MIIAMRRTMIGAVLISVGIYAEKRAEKNITKKKALNQEDSTLFLVRCVAESNRLSWFCRPETKPFIQRTRLN